MSRYNVARVLDGTPLEINRELLKVAESVNAAVHTDRATTITVTHTWAASQTFSAGLNVSGLTGSNLLFTAANASSIAGAVFTVPTVQDWSAGVRTTGVFVLNSGNVFAGTDVFALTPAGVLTLSAYGSGGGQVTVGAADSGGAGYRLLRVPN